jgi:hypothetical protein
MATLEMIQLRSMMPHTGRVTLRYALPTVKIDVPADFRAADLPRITTTPQVESPVPDEGELETTARKGGEAR